MRFTAQLHVSSEWLTLRFLPLFEKLGKELVVLLKPDRVHLARARRRHTRTGARAAAARRSELRGSRAAAAQIYDATRDGGMEVQAEIKPDELFVAGTYQVTSAYNNVIGVRVEPGALLRVLRFLFGMQPDTCAAPRLPHRPFAAPRRRVTGRRASPAYSAPAASASQPAEEAPLRRTWRVRTALVSA